MANLVSGKVVEMADKAMEATGMASSKAQEASKVVTMKANPDPSGATMQAVHYKGTRSIEVREDCPKPAITDEKDAIIRVTSTALCGTDLHLYLGHVPGMKSGQVLGHEVIGYVESVGPKVSGVKPGDRVIVSCQIACGDCYFCKQQLFSMCDKTNPSTTQEGMMGAKAAVVIGFSELNGGMAGGQADFIRVPIADVNLLKIPPESEQSDDKLIFLSDILVTAWYANELAETRPGDVVAIWGAGPVGLLAAQSAFVRGARRVILVDEQAYRLDFAKRILPKVETVNFAKDSKSSAGEKQVLELCKDEPAGGPDACIECVGMHYAHSFIHRLEMAVGLETDTPEALNAAIYACKKGGRIGVIGVYVGLCNHFNFGTLMEKCISLKAGVVPLQKYWKELLDMIVQGKMDPSVIITHHMNLDEAAKAYEMFNNKSDNCVKVIMHPRPSRSTGK